MGPLQLLAALLVPRGETVVLTDVTLIDVEAASAGEARQPGRTVILAGDRIRWIGPAAGKFLIPGLFDMHVHLAGQGDAARGEGEYLRRTRIGVRTEDDVLEAVGRVAESGADVLKFRNTPNAEVFRFLMSEARLAGLQVAGHEPNTVDLLEAASLGLGSLEHLPIRACMGGTGPERSREICAAMVGHGGSCDADVRRDGESADDGGRARGGAGGGEGGSALGDAHGGARRGLGRTARGAA